MENISLKVDQLNGPEIVIREGEALPLSLPEKIKIAGDIKSISSFLKGRKSGWGSQFVDPNKAIVTVDKKVMTIQLELDPEYHYGTTVTGSLESSDELKKWFINQPRTFKQKELVHLIRFSRVDFDDADKHAMLLKSYQSFNFKTYIDSQSESDTRGNKSNSFTKKTETGLPVDFVLNIPIFKGQGAMRFHVEICLETTEGSANFWFESVELNELIEVNKEIIFNEELTSCEGFVIINK